MDNTTGEEIKKKRGRKKKELTNTENTNNGTNTVVDKVHKKRGRKPKGGKIINTPNTSNNDKLAISNIILHLKCSLDDLNDNKISNDHLQYVPNPPPDIKAYNPQNNNNFTQFSIQDNTDDIQYNEDNAYQSSSNLKTHIDTEISKPVENKPPIEDDDDIDIKDINTKLKQIKIQLYKNNNPDKKSACFWCTYEFDNPPCYIPKYEFDLELCGYGSFCRPECAVAYLLKENIDDSMKFERYHLLNKIYSKVYDFQKNIKPAPDPHYLLDKFYGNLNIQEYRKLMKTEHMLLIIEKPMTRILPELHENTDDMDNTGIHGSKKSNSKQSGVYKVKRQSEKQKGPSKNDIMKENFGF